jgi:hypothetical protein
MQNLPAKTGWIWVKEGWKLFKKQPTELSILFISYLLILLIISSIPVVSQCLSFILMPTLSIAFLQACVHIEQKTRVRPNLLLTGIHSPAFKTLIKLGILYFLAITLVIAASSLVDGGTFWKIMSGQQAIDPKNVNDSNMSLAILFSGLLYIPVAMAFWYAAPLVFWHNMGIRKAVFYSFFAVYRAGSAFAVYVLAWAIIGVVLPGIISSIVAVLIGQSIAVIMIMMPLSILVTIIMYCSFYATYTGMFGKTTTQDLIKQP